MASELALAGVPTGLTVVAHVRRDSDEFIWDTVSAAFEVYANADNLTGRYNVTMTEQGTSGYYVGNFPTLITAAGRYNITYYTRTGLSGAFVYTYEASYNFEWDGSAESEPTSPSSGINWITRADFKLWAGIATTDYDTMIDLMIPFASAACNQYLDRTIKSTGHSKVYRGKVASAMSLNQYPVTALTDVTFDYYGTNPTVVSGTEFYVNEIGTLRFKPSSIDRRHFGSPFVKVTFTAGYTTVPYDLQMACMLVVKAQMFLSDDDQTVIAKDVKDIKFKYGNPLMADASDPLLGNARVLLDAHRQDQLVV